MADRAEKETLLKAQSRELNRSAKAVERSSDEMVDSADRRTTLAGDRTLLAAERTYAAWVRTALAALAAGRWLSRTRQERDAENGRPADRIDPHRVCRFLPSRRGVARAAGRPVDNASRN